MSIGAGVVHGTGAAIRYGATTFGYDRQLLAESSPLKLPHLLTIIFPLKLFSILHNPHEPTPASPLNWPVS